MAENKKDPLELFLEHLTGFHEPDDSKWQQVAKFGPEQTLKHRLFCADSDRRGDQLKVLIAKVEALSAEPNAAHQEFLGFLYDTLKVPRDWDYHISVDGRLLFEPKAEK